MTDKPKHESKPALAGDADYMRQCLDIGCAASVRGEAPVGAILVRDGRIFSSAEEATRSNMDVTAHAEVLAIRKATEALGSMDLTGCTLFTNVEPCVLCSYAIRRTRINRVVIGAPTGSLGGVTSEHPILIESGIPGFGDPPEITEGVLLEECLALLKKP